MAEHGGQLVEIAGAHVDDGGKLVDARPRSGTGGGHHVDKRDKQFGRQVVDHIPSHVFHAVSGMRAACAGHTGDEQHLEGIKRGRLVVRSRCGCRGIRRRIRGGRLAGIADCCLLTHYNASSRALRIAISSWSSSVVVSCRRWSASLGGSSSQIPVISNTCTRAWYSSISSPPMA